MPLPLPHPWRERILQVQQRPIIQQHWQSSPQTEGISPVGITSCSQPVPSTQLPQSRWPRQQRNINGKYSYHPPNLAPQLAGMVAMVAGCFPFYIRPKTEDDQANESLPSFSTRSCSLCFSEGPTPAAGHFPPRRLPSSPNSQRGKTEKYLTNFSRLGGDLLRRFGRRDAAIA